MQKGYAALKLSSPDSADLVMLLSKGGHECAKSDTVSVSLADLQEMQNHMREIIDQGLHELQAKQGTGGLLAAPPNRKHELPLHVEENLCRCVRTKNSSLVR